MQPIAAVAAAMTFLIAAAQSLSAAESLRQREEQAFKAALARVAPSVVRIETVGGLERVGQILIGTGPTTGLVVSADGYIISSAFNFVQKPDSILVTLDDGSRHAARLVASDRSRMLVLLKIDAPHKLPVPEAAPAGAMRVGQWALAVGRTFEPRQPNVSVGIVSALDRVWGKAIQTDAKISPNNYGGPLVDIAGRVLGVLVPMSPEGNEEVAGVEWYDSGIGFAIPLETVFGVLPKLEQGQDLHPGLLGVNMKGADLYSQPAQLAAVRATSPAYKAGLRVGDTIVEAGGDPVTRQAQLKHALGRLYAGDTIKIAALRGTERIERELVLAEKIDPYEFPFLGILPMRFSTEEKAAGVVVRYVYPDSPAAGAGIKPLDRLKTLDGQPMESLEALQQKLQSLSVGDKVHLEVVRGDESLALDAQLSRLPETLPGPLPAARGALPPKTEPDAEGESRPKVGVVALKIPEFENECLAYVPESYDPRLAYGVVVWLHAPGGLKADELVELWKPLCDEHDLILVAPKSADRTRWQATEGRFVRRVLDDVAKNYTTDPARIVVHGHEGGGAMAYLVASANDDVVRAVAAVDAPLPRLVQIPPTDPVHRLAFYTTLTTKSETSAAVENTIKRLREMKYPVVVQTIGEQARYLTRDELAELARWIDTLDRK
jgi:serine protease Do